VKGQQTLVDVRLRGINPTWVYIGVDEDWPDWFTRDWVQPTYPGADLRARLVIEPDDTIERLDLRCVYGLPVEVAGDDEERVRSVAVKCAEEGALMVHQFVGDTWPK
jgi:hypothetical protein